MAEYLDRDDVLNVIDYIRTKYISVYNRRDKCSQFWADTIRYFEKRINKLDDCDVEPVRHGHWYNRGGRFRCSACDNKALLKDIGGTGGWSHEYEQQKSPYCPNCGAKMDGGDLNGS